MGRNFNKNIWSMDRYTFKQAKSLHGTGRATEKNGILLQVKKAAGGNHGDLTCHVSTLKMH